MYYHIAFFFFFNDTATTEIYTLSLHDALPIFSRVQATRWSPDGNAIAWLDRGQAVGVQPRDRVRSEEHTSELQSPCKLVCRLLLEKKKETFELLSLQPENIVNAHSRSRLAATL